MPRAHPATPDSPVIFGPEAGEDGLTIAVEGCCHGELDRIYETLEYLQQQEGVTVDLLLCCGDFQAVRNLDDLQCMACPDKYKSMQTFYKYYSGEKTAPVPTVFIGGNHEASNYLWSLHYGGWAAPNIYYMGAAGVVNFGGIRIAGLSGIFKKGAYKAGHHERPPYDSSSMRSAYHVRQLEVFRLQQLQQPIDVFLSHDWPAHIAKHGNTSQLYKHKPFLKSEVEDGSLGNPPAMELLRELQPAYWFSAHLHTKFAAVVPHASPRGAVTETRFLSLNKCLPGRQFLQLVPFPGARGPKRIQVDEEWLSVLRATHHLMSLSRRGPTLPAHGGCRAQVTEAHRAAVRSNLAATGSEPPAFQITAPVYDPVTEHRRKGVMPTSTERQPQTLTLLEKYVGVAFNLVPAAGDTQPHPPTYPHPSHGEAVPGAPPPPPLAMPAHDTSNAEEVDLDEGTDALNPEEIVLSD